MSFRNVFWPNVFQRKAIWQNFFKRNIFLWWNAVWPNVFWWNVIWPNVFWPNVTQRKAPPSFIDRRCQSFFFRKRQKCFPIFFGQRFFVIRRFRKFIRSISRRKPETEVADPEKDATVTSGQDNGGLRSLGHWDCNASLIFLQQQRIRKVRGSRPGNFVSKSYVKDQRGEGLHSTEVAILLLTLRPGVRLSRFRCCWDLSTALVRGKWTEAWKCW